MPHLTDEELFLKAYEEYADAIYRHCFFRISDEEKARDLMQETYTRAWRYLAQGNKVDNIRAFLYRTANNLLIDTYRKKKAFSLDEHLEHAPDPEIEPPEKFSERVEASFALRCVEQLDDPYKEVIIMRYVDDLPVKEISRILDESENTISVRLYRGLKKAKVILEQGAPRPKKAQT